MATFAANLLAKDEVLDHSQCLSDVSMEDGNDGGPRPLSPTTQPDGGPKSGRLFTSKLDRMLQEQAKYIKRVDENTISIPNTSNFAAYVLQQYCGDIQIQSFEHELRTEGYKKREGGRVSVRRGVCGSGKRQPSPIIPLQRTQRRQKHRLLAIQVWKLWYMNFKIS